MLEAVIEVSVQENDPEYLLKAIGDIARSKGMAQIARELKLDRAGLLQIAFPGGQSVFFPGGKGFAQARILYQHTGKRGFVGFAI